MIHWNADSVCKREFSKFYYKLIFVKLFSLSLGYEHITHGYWTGAFIDSYYKSIGLA